MQDGRRSGRQPARWYFVVLTVVTLLSCYWASGPVWSYDLVFLMFPAWLWLVLYWFFRGLGEIRTTGWVTVRRQWFRWALTPLVFLGMVVALAVDGPLWVRFTLSEPIMQAYAKTIASGEEVDESCRWRGLYHVCWSSPIDGGAKLDVNDLGILENSATIQTTGAGFVWFPGGGDPTRAAGDQTSDLPFAEPWLIWKGWDSM
ncbi:hypothetical protein [Streptosporangium sp. NPDC048865]|uniref:hypothetical protein n=1 Tax=Streptosporangium sp. NPDC048865 TaxID=3155766 RepID=UPI0034242AD5